MSENDGPGGGGSGEQLARVALIVSAVALALSILGLFLPLAG
jgi:hypothetical protein